MKKSILLFLCMAFSCQWVLAQGALPSGAPGGCAIIYDYYAAGNRIKRSKYCWSGGGGTNNKPSSTANSSIQKSMLIEVYPNPSKQFCIVTTSESIVNGSIEIQDMGGKTIFKRSISNSKSTKIDLSTLASGAYMVLLSDLKDQRRWVKKLVKE